MKHSGAVLAAIGSLCWAGGGQAEPAKPLTSADILAAAPASDWRPVDPQNTLYMDLPAGRVVIELDPAMAPAHVANIRTLVREHYFDGLVIERAQDNYVVQWGDPDAKRPLGSAKTGLPAEYSRKIVPGEGFARLPDPDTYAPEVGFSDGFPAARDPASGETWLTHCYGMVGVGRDVPPDTGSGAELYAVIGNAPRHLDRNIALVGKVIRGMELLSVMPRGTGDMGFYDKPEQRVPIRQVVVAADLPAPQRLKLEEMRTDSASFAAWIEAKRHRTDPWFVEPGGRAEVCNISVPVRAAK